jgi:hypothetical protein
MRVISLTVGISIVLSSATIAQQNPATLGESIGSPPPLPGPPPISGAPPIAGPSASTPPAIAAPTPKGSGPSPKGDTGAYAPAQAGAPSVQQGAVPEVNTGPGLNKVGPDGVSTRTVRAVPCSIAARETDGTTTCIGIPEKGAKAKNRR